MCHFVQNTELVALRSVDGVTDTGKTSLVRWVEEAFDAGAVMATPTNIRFTLDLAQRSETTKPVHLFFWNEMGFSMFKQGNRYGLSLFCPPPPGDLLKRFGSNSLADLSRSPPQTIQPHTGRSR